MQKLKHQRGAVMLEAAYVLPLVLLVVLLMIESVSYALTTYVVSDQVYKLHSQIMAQVGEVAGSGTTTSSTPVAVCVSHKVELQNAANMASLVKTGVPTAYQAKFTTPLSATFSMEVVNDDLDVYVIAVKAAVTPNVLSGFGISLPININTLVSINESC